MCILVFSILCAADGQGVLSVLKTEGEAGLAWEGIQRGVRVLTSQGDMDLVGGELGESGRGCNQGVGLRQLIDGT